LNEILVTNGKTESKQRNRKKDKKQKLTYECTVDKETRDRKVDGSAWFDSRPGRYQVI